MTNISQPLKPRPDRPVEPLALRVISEIQQASRELGFPVFLVGAVARIILLENIHGLQAGPGTTDVDFAFALDNWDQFRAIKDRLLASAKFEESKHVAHRLHFQLPGVEHPYKVDLIPFEGIETSPGIITWPPDMAVMMNVAGFGDALAASMTVEVAPEMEIKVASLPGIAILKIFAWADRGHENPKDAIDLVLLLRSYNEAGNANRIYEEANSLAALEAAGYDPELAGAWLLGSDVAAMASAPTNTALESLLSGPKRQRLIEDMARAMLGRDDSLEYSDRLLEQFTGGFTA
jgi:predicted nucleotidyltransferase